MQEFNIENDTLPQGKSSKLPDRYTIKGDKLYDYGKLVAEGDLTHVKGKLYSIGKRGISIVSDIVASRLNEGVYLHLDTTFLKEKPNVTIYNNAVLVYTKNVEISLPNMELNIVIPYTKLDRDI